MNIDTALTEPGVRLIELHNWFNRNIKIIFGALEALTQQLPAGNDEAAFVLPSGGEPWGKTTRWRNLVSPVREAATFLAEIGIARATASSTAPTAPVRNWPRCAPIPNLPPP